MARRIKGKLVADSAVHDQTAVVFPNDLNAYGTLFGGRVVDLCDRLAGVVAKRHSGRMCVTLGIDSVRFLAPAKHGDILVLKCSINRAWKTSMEVGVSVWKEDFQTLKRTHIVSAYFTFVALDDQGRPASVPLLIPKTADEKRRYSQAEHRRRYRLQTAKAKVLA